MDNIYESTAVITPQSDLKDKAGGLASMASQLGGLAGIAGIAGISLPGTTSVYELESLLDSNTVREKVIVKNNLLPVLFDDDWDEVKNEWKEPLFFVKWALDFKKWIKSAIPVSKKSKIEESDVPTVWDGLRLLDKKVLKIDRDVKSNMVTITVQFHDPEMSAKLVDDFLTGLADYMSAEAKRVANTNRKYLEEQLVKAVDPVVREKIYAMLTHQIETSLMAEVKENFAFKVLERPKVPDKKVKPKRALMVLAALFGSTFIGIMIAVYRESVEKQKAMNAAGVGEVIPADETEKRGMGETGSVRRGETTGG
jgi:uncharacterized protein involved in exopolysaccharide biosynthesis